MYNDMDFDALLDRVRTLEGQVGDLIAEVARLRSVDPMGRLGDLEYRVSNIEASPLAPGGIDARLRALEELASRRDSVRPEPLINFLD